MAPIRRTALRSLRRAVSEDIENLRLFSKWTVFEKKPPPEKSISGGFFVLKFLFCAFIWLTAVLM